MIKKNLGIMRYLKEPYGTWKKYKLYTVNGKPYKPDFDIYIRTGKYIYPEEFYKVYDLLNDTPYITNGKSKSTKKKHYTTEKWYVPDKMQPVFYITEEKYDKRGSFVEAKFAKYVPYEEWLKIPLYKANTVNWVH